MSVILTPEQFESDVLDATHYASDGEEFDRVKAHDAEQRRIITLLVTALDGARCGHIYVEDDYWYSCPKAIDPDTKKPVGGHGDKDDDRCYCGADAHNAKIDAALAAVRGES